MRPSQRGVGWFGFLIVVAIAVAVGYYAYKGIWQADEQQLSCPAALNACIKNCRRTTTEAPEAQRCQEACQREADACASTGR
jgi:cytochrome c-type biogenesis protein CcmH/NrfG